MFKVDVDIEIEDKSDGHVSFARHTFPLPEDLSLRLIIGLADIITKPVLVGLLHVQYLFTEESNNRVWSSLSNQKIVEGIIPIFCQHSFPLFIHLHNEMYAMHPQAGLFQITSPDYDIVASAFWSIVNNPTNWKKTIELANITLDALKDGK